jgi:hypothetical protein
METTGLRIAEEWIGEQRAAWETRLDRLGVYLADDSKPKPERST